MGPGLRQLRPGLPTRSPARTGAPGGNRRTRTPTTRPRRQRCRNDDHNHGDRHNKPYYEEGFFWASACCGNSGSGGGKDYFANGVYYEEGFFWASPCCGNSGIGGGKDYFANGVYWAQVNEGAPSARAAGTSSRRRSAWRSAPPGGSSRADQVSASYFKLRSSHELPRSEFICPSLSLHL